MTTEKATATELTIEQFNANERKLALQAAKNAVLALYKSDRAAFLHNLQFDKSDRAFVQEVEYTAKKATEKGIVTYTAKAALRMTLFDFVLDKSDRATLKDRLSRIAEYASDMTSESRAAALPLIANI